MTTSPSRANVVLVAVLGVLLALVVAWRTGVHLHPASIDLSWFVAGALTAVLLGLFLHATPPGTRLLDYLSNTNAGQLLVLLLGAAIIVLFRGVLDARHAAELASVLLGASIGSLARLAVD